MKKTNVSKIVLRVKPEIHWHCSKLHTLHISKVPSTQNNLVPNSKTLVAGVTRTAVLLRALILELKTTNFTFLKMLKNCHSNTRLHPHQLQ